MKRKEMKGNKSKKTIVTIRTILLWAAWLALFVGCQADAVDGANEAAADGDRNGVPVADGDELSDEAISGMIGIRLTPPVESGLPRQQTMIDMDDFSGEIVLETGYRYSGEVQDPNRNPSEATLSLIPSDSMAKIPGVPLPNITLTTTSLDRTSKAGFSALVPEGVYTVYVFPKDGSLVPPIALHEGLEIAEDTLDILRFEKGIRVNGTVLDADGDPLEGVQVMAVQENPWRRSNLSVSDEYGAVSLQLSLEPAIYDIQLSAQADIRIPERTLEQVLQVDASGRASILQNHEEDELLLNYEAFDPRICTLTGRILGFSNRKSDSESLDPVSEATLSFEAEVGGGVFEASVQTDENGRYSIDLLRLDSDNETNESGGYRVTVTPPIEGGNAYTELNGLTCPSSEETAADIVLNRRLILSGIVSDANQSAVAGVEVQAHRKSSDADRNVYVKSAYTGSNGLYQLAVDPGTFDLVFLPSLSTGLGRATVRDFQTSTDGTVDQVLFVGRNLSGKIVTIAEDANDGENRVPVPWVSMEIYRIRSASDSSELIGSGSTDEDGRFDIIIP